MTRKKKNRFVSTVNVPATRKIAGFAWVGALAFLTYAGVAVSSPQPSLPGPSRSAATLPEDSAPAPLEAVRSGFSREGELERGTRSRGWASWYGPELHGEPTASGEPFDMHDLTAAHRTLPLGTRVQVRNLTNGRSVEVRINDRGPFPEERIIDLSRAAAGKIGMIPTGSALVEVVPL
jgi:rare lipoprotein A (peptidoglycan hydrolase)